MRGRPALPLEQAISRGVEGAEDRAQRAPPRIEGVPNPPAGLDHLAIDCWIRVSALLFARGQLSLESGPALEAMCQCYSDWIRLRDALRSGFTQSVYSGDDLVDKARPEAALFADVDRRWMRWLTEFGLTDATRGKVVGAIAPGGDAAGNPLSAYGLQ